MSGRAGAADDFLEEYYDVIVLSTGLGSSILAAALAKSGKSVLHLDKNEYYGEDTASFSFTQLLDWVDNHQHSNSRTRKGRDAADAGPGLLQNTVENSTTEKNTIDALLLDMETVGRAMARGHARHQLKEDRKLECKAAEQEAAEQEAAEQQKCAVGASEGVGTTQEIEGQQQQQEPGAAAEFEEEEAEHKSPVNINGAQNLSAHGDDGDHDHDRIKTGQQEEEEERREEKEEMKKEEEDNAIVDKNAAERLESLELELLPLSHHGCRTRAGTPSDSCTQERLLQKAAEVAAAASGRFERQPRPSHPAWIGARAPCKEAAVGGRDEEEGKEEVLHPAFWGYRTERRPNAADLVRLSRSFNLDLTSQVLLATGPAVDALVDSGVSNYLEFKDMQALYLASDIASQSAGVAGGVGEKRGGRSDGKAEGVHPTAGLGLSRVPCSKADVFGTKLLTPLEKRRLMRFLLFASDWGLQRAGEDVSARNEAGLGRGRSLRRPQNRETASGDFDAEAHTGKPFREFLQSCGLPERVRAMITHALALLPGDGGEGAGGGDVSLGEATTEAGLEAVHRHLSALGRFGETAFIAPLYGVGELPQSFCRMAAVHGAVYVLRRQLKGAMVDRVTGRCVGVVDDSGRAFACGSLVVGGEYFTPSPATAAINTTTTTTNTTTTTTTTTTKPNQQPQSAAAASRATPNPHETDEQVPTTLTLEREHDRSCRRLLRRVVLASGPVAPEGAGRGLCVLPPGLRSVGNVAAVHVVSLDEETVACPRGLDGACVLQLTTTTAVRSSDEGDVGSAEVVGSSRGGGGERIGGDWGEFLESVDSVVDEDGSDGVLGRAARALMEAAGVQEIWSVGFSWDIQEPHAREDLPPNMVVCGPQGQELYLHEVIVRAERDFAHLCPGEPFWPSPKASGQEEDDQAEMLRAAASAVSGNADESAAAKAEADPN